MRFCGYDTRCTVFIRWYVYFIVTLINRLATRNKAADTKKKNSGESKVKQSAQVTNVQDADVDNDSNDVENGMASKKSKLNDSFNMEESSVNEVVNAEESSVNDVLNVEDSFVEEDVVPDVSPMDADE